MAANVHVVFSLLRLQPHISFPQGATANEEILLRWVHFVAGIIWIGLLYFFNLINRPSMNALEGPTRIEVFPVLMTRAMWWFRWSALVTVLAGLRYFMVILAADAHNAGNPSLEWRWLGYWFLTWMVAYAFLYALQLPGKGWTGSGWSRVVPVALVVILAAWEVLRLNASSQSSNSHLSISIGGGLGLTMLLNAWGVVWRVQKKMIAWNRTSAEKGTPTPPEAARLARWAFLASRTSFWLSFPMLFFMGAADHYPFLSSITD